MSGRHRSIAVLLSVNGDALGPTAFSSVPGVQVIRVECARGERAACVTATMWHDGSSRDLLGRLRPWAAGNGWSITVAPLPSPD